MIIETTGYGYLYVYADYGCEWDAKPLPALYRLVDCI